MKMKIMFMLVISCFVNGMQASQNERWVIRPATIDDKDVMIQITKRTHAFYDYYIISDERIESWISDSLKKGLRSGFAFVVEDSQEGKVVAFMVMSRRSSTSRSHILYDDSWAVDPDFKDEMLINRLYKHLFQQVTEHHPDILRIEEEGSHPESIAIFEEVGFTLEGRRENSLRRADGDFDTEILYAWMNPNFDANLMKK